MNDEFCIGGYVVMRYGGDAISDWEDLDAVLPTREAALAHVREAIGASSLDEAFARQAQLKKKAAANGNDPDRHDRHQWGTIYAVSPELSKSLAAVLAHPGKAWGFVERLYNPQHPYYLVGNKPVLCTYAEEDNYSHRPRPSAGGAAMTLS